MKIKCHSRGKDAKVWRRVEEDLSLEYAGWIKEHDGEYSMSIQVYLRDRVYSLEVPESVINMTITRLKEYKEEFKKARKEKRKKGA